MENVEYRQWYIPETQLKNVNGEWVKVEATCPRLNYGDGELSNAAFLRDAYWIGVQINEELDRGLLKLNEITVEWYDLSIVAEHAYQNSIQEKQKKEYEKRKKLDSISRRR